MFIYFEKGWDLKKLLKKISLFRILNAFIKSRIVKYKYNRLVRLYSKKSYFNNLKVVFDDIWVESVKSKLKPIVYFIGTDESQDKGGLIPDLEELVDLVTFYKNDGRYGQYSGLRHYNGIQGRVLNTLKVINDIEYLISCGRKPDLILMQAWGRSFEIEKLIAFKNKHQLKFINISLDDRLVFVDKTPKNEKYNYGISGLIQLTDLFLVSNPEVVNWYHTERSNALYFPMASSLKFFKPLTTQKKFDVGFIGNCYGYRSELINYLIRNGISVQAYGNGWNNGYLDSSKANSFFNECKVVLGIGTVGHCRNFFTQKLRDFDVPLSGSVYVTNNNIDLIDLYPNGGIVLADTKHDFLRKIKCLLSDSNMRAVISRKAYTTAKNSHTYNIRFIKLFEELGIQLAE